MQYIIKKPGGISYEVTSAKKICSDCLAGVMSFSVAFSGNLTVSAEDVQNGIVTGTSGEDDGQAPENGEEDGERYWTDT